MSVRRIDSQQSFYHTSYVCNDLFSATDRYRLFREKILPQLMKLRPQLERLYCTSNGRPAIDPVLLCGVTLLQFMEKLSDRRAAEQVAYHLGWKYALDLELAFEGFHPTVLVYFRDRLEENQAAQVIFDGIIDLLIALGLIKRAGKQRIDSTHILGYVKEMGRLECTAETMRLAMEELAEIGVKKRPQCWDRMWVVYVQSEVDWRLSKSERQSRYRQLGQDIKELLGWIDQSPAEFEGVESVKLLRGVFAEQFEIVEGEIQARQSRPSQAVQNPHDPDAHYGNKGSKQWIGYKVHVVESVDPEQPAKTKSEPGEHFITEILTSEAAENEVAGLAGALKRQQEQHQITPEAMYADAGYITENTLAQAQDNAMKLLGPTRPDPHKSREAGSNLDFSTLEGLS
jgi:transposase